MKSQTYSLRVSIHCEGCNKKVKKLLQRIEGLFYFKHAKHFCFTSLGILKYMHYLFFFTTNRSVSRKGRSRAPKGNRFRLC